MSMYATIELEKSGSQDLPRELDPEGEGLVYGQNLGQCGMEGIEELDSIAAEAGATALSGFLDDSEMLDADEREEMGLPPAEPKWSEVAEGIKTLRAIVAELNSRPPDSPLGRYTADALLWDLRASLAILERAANSRERFRFSVG